MTPLPIGTPSGIVDGVSGYLYVLAATFAGLLIGVIINWLADDLPYTFRIGLPHYPDGDRRPLIAWSGLGAFLSGTHVSEHGAALSWRYPLTEVITAILFAYIAAFYAPSARTLYWFGHLFFLVLITVIDLEHRLILFVVIIPACLWAVLCAAVAAPIISARITFTDYLIGGVAGFLVFFLLYLGGILFNRSISRARGEPVEEVAFGYGDVLLALLAGLILGWQALIFALVIAVFAGGAGSLIYLIVRSAIQRDYEMFTAFPYGQYIVFGTLIMLLWRAPVINILQR